MGGFYLFLSSQDSISLYPLNKYDDFTVEFDRPIELPETCGFGYTQTWRFALTEISLETVGGKDRRSLPESVVVLTDLCATSYIHATEAPVLRTIGAKGELGSGLGQIYYIAVNKSSFNRLRIQIRDRELKPLVKNNQEDKLWPERGVLKCSLHFIRS